LVLGNVAEQDLGGLRPGRGEHNPSAELGYEPLSPEASQTAALRAAIASLSEPARRELYSLMRIGQGDLSARKWHRGLSEAGMLGDDTITAAIIEDADLHDHCEHGQPHRGPSANRWPYSRPARTEPAPRDRSAHPRRENR
jgi:hypothetical protein